MTIEELGEIIYTKDHPKLVLDALGFFKKENFCIFPMSI